MAWTKVPFHFMLSTIHMLIRLQYAAVDFVQQYMLKEGSQNNESAAEQLKDETISDQIRAQYKNMTGKDFPIADK